jgi:hypothetical protein
LGKLASQTYTSGTLRQGGTGRAPDGGASADYSKGWRFLPTERATPQQIAELKEHPQVAEAMRNLANMPQGALPKGSTSREVRNQQIATYNAQQQNIIDTQYHRIVIAPLIKAQEEAIARKEEEERLAIATLKMRVIELEKRPTPTPGPTPPEITTSPTSYLPLAVVGIVIVVILLFLRRRA